MRGLLLKVIKKQFKKGVFTFPFTVRTETRRRHVKINARNFTDAVNTAVSMCPGKFINVSAAMKIQQYINKLNNKESVVTTRLGGVVSVSVQPNEDVDDRPEPYIPKAIIHKYVDADPDRHLKPINKMDLLNAKKKAIKESKGKKTVYLNVSADGEVTVDKEANTDGTTLYATYKNGSEIASASKLIPKEKNEPTVKGSKKLNSAKSPITVEESDEAVEEISSTKNSKSKNMKTDSKKSAPAKKSSAPVKKEATAKKVAGNVVSKTIKQLIEVIESGKRVFKPNGTEYAEGYFKTFKVKNRDQKREVIIK